MQGLIVASHGRQFLAELEDKTIIECVSKGRKTGICVGDEVIISMHDSNGRIDEVLPRKNLLYRSDMMRSKQFAANVDQLFIVTATEPLFSEDLLSRAIVAAKSIGIECSIILNKCDLQDKLAKARELLQHYQDLGISVIESSTQAPQALCERFMPLLANKTTLLLGQSGMGKSSILNVLVPHANAFTQEHSHALGTGKHTTTNTRLYRLDNGGKLIDSPGFQAFGLTHLKQTDIENGFPEFGEHIDHCRFYNCTHLHEPGCGVLKALNEGKIKPSRHQLYTRILNESDIAASQH